MAAVPSVGQFPSAPKGGVLPKGPRVDQQQAGSSASSASEALLQAIIPYLQTESLPAAVQEQLGSFKSANIHMEGRHLPALVAQQAQLKRELHKLKFQRDKYEQELAKYVASLSDMFLEQLKVRDDVLNRYEEKEQLWLQQLSSTSLELQQRTAKENQRKEDGARAMEEDDEPQQTAKAAEMQLQRAKARRTEQAASDLELQQALQTAKARAEAQKWSDRTPRRNGKSKDQEAVIDLTGNSKEKSPR